MSEPGAAVEAQWLEPVSFWVAGSPAPQGSKVPIPIYRGKGKNKVFTGQVYLKEQAGKALDDWREEVRKEAAQVLTRMNDRVPFLGGVTVGMGFTVRRGKTVTRDRPSVRSDLSKLIRAVEDAITDGKLWGDDGQVVGYHWLEECYAGDTWLLGAHAGERSPERTGVLIEIRPTEPNPARSVPAQRRTGSRQDARTGRGRLLEPVECLEPSEALLEALRDAGADPEASPWT